MVDAIVLDTNTFQVLETLPMNLVSVLVPRLDQQRCFRWMAGLMDRFIADWGFWKECPC